MRTVSVEIESAILDSSSHRLYVKAFIDPSRTFFSEHLAENHYGASDFGEATNTPTGQCMVYSTELGKAYTFIVNPDPSSGVIYGMVQDSATPTSLGITADPDTKPSAWKITETSVKLYYWKKSPSTLAYCTVNLSNFSTSGHGTIDILADINPGWTAIAGSPTAIGSDSLVVCYKTSLGGIGIALKMGADWHHWNQRFMSPKALTSTDWTIYTTAVAFEDYIYIYSTDVDGGNVRAVKFDAYTNTWSDIFIALPADFSRFDIGNAKVVNGYVHIAGQFHRTEEFADAEIYSLILRSPNGKNFSWDRFTLLSNTGYQYQIDIDATNKKVYASDRNYVGVADMSYYFTQEPTNRVILEPPSSIISFSTTGPTARMAVSASDETYIDNATVSENNRVTIYLGYMTSNGIEYTSDPYGTYIIDLKDTGFADGSRDLIVNLVNEGIWKTNQIAFPFYAEIISKSSQYDNCDSLDRMYVVPCHNNDKFDFLSIDFWNSEEWDGDGVVTDGVNFNWCAPQEATICTATNVGGESGQLRGKTLDLNSHPYMNTYPTILGTFEAWLYGWENTGATGSRNGNEYRIYAITAPEDDLEDITVTLGTLVSTYNQFPNYYFDTSVHIRHAGSYPIKYSFSGLTEGHKILYFGITARNTVEGTSRMYLERLEIRGSIRFDYIPSRSSTAWSLEKPTGESRDYLVSPDTSLQNLMFTTKPYSAFNFNIAAEFGYSAGDNPLSAGHTAWGVVGLAKDGQDFVCARYKRQNNKIELLLFRNGEWTILDSYSQSEIYQLMLDHRNGLFRVWYKGGTEWTGPVISYQYDEVTHGVLSTSDTGIMHTGIYSAIYPPSFIATAFSQAYSDGICMTTDQYTTSGDRNDFGDGFPDAGHFLLNGSRYAYTGKSSGNRSIHRGPNQLRQVTNIGTWQEGGLVFEGIGIEIALYEPANAVDFVENLLIGQSNSHNWIITMSDWTVTHSTAGQPDYLMTRSRHQSERAVHERTYAASIADRCYINSGLIGVTLVEGNGYRHPQGALCSLWSTDKIWVKKVTATQIDHDATVEDMITYLCHAASIEAEFPGNWISETLAISSTPVPLGIDGEAFPGGCDVRFQMPAVLSTSGDHITLTAENLIIPETTENFTFGFKNSGGNLAAFVRTSSDTIYEQVKSALSANKPHTVRILVHDDFVSFYANNQTVATFALGIENKEWEEEALNLELYSNKSTTLNNVVVSELFDWREAIYVESEMSASNAISSVIQERPIEIYPTREGNLSFSYRFIRDTITYTAEQSKKILRKHSEKKQNSANAGSDALIYYANIAFVSNPDYALTHGFNTRVFKLASLDTGAKLASRLLLEKAYERQTQHGIILRPDIRLEEGDIVDLTYITSGTGKEINAITIIENINISITEGDYEMNITGRGT
jgi:hypothetical protein